jgi:hypothetical protein
MAKRTYVKTTQDGRKLEVVGLAICLDDKLECFELMDVKLHPNRRAILRAAPEADFMAGRVTLTKEEAEIIRKALQEANDEIIASPTAMNERFRIAFMHRAREQGIE